MRDVYLIGIGQTAVSKNGGVRGRYLVVTACNRNWPGLQSTEIWDQIICIYPSLQDGIICN
jgi:hypothetical protein